MMLYTIIPIEDVLEGIDGELPPKVDVVMGGVHLQVEPLSIFQDVWNGSSAPTPRSI